MVSRTWLINAILALFVAFLGLKAYGVWFQENKGMEIPKMTRSPIPRVAKPLGVLDNIKIPPEPEYSALMSLNLFSPERTEVLPDETKPNEGKKAISTAQQKNLEQFLKKITLYGMVITEDSAEALVSDIAIKSTVRRGKTLNHKKLAVKQTKWVKVGDTLGEFQVAEIKPDGILLKAGSMTFDLLLYDEKRIKNRAPAQPKAGPTVVGIAGEKLVVKGKTEKGTLPAPLKKRTEAAQASPSIPSEAADTYEDFLKRTGNQKAIKNYQNQKR